MWGLSKQQGRKDTYFPFKSNMICYDAQMVRWHKVQNNFLHREYVKGEITHLKIVKKNVKSHLRVYQSKYYLELHILNIIGTVNAQHLL